MAVIGSSGGVNDIYTDSTAVIGASSVIAGASLNLDSTGQVLPLSHQKIANAPRVQEDIQNSSYYNVSATSQYGNPVLPDGRSIYILTYSAGDAWAVLLEDDGFTRAGTTYATLDQSGNTATNQFTFWQVGETDDYYQVGIAYRSYYSNYTYVYQKVFMVTVAKASNSLAVYSMPTSYYTTANYTSATNWNYRFASSRDVNNWHTCRHPHSASNSGGIHLFATPYTTEYNYRFTAFATQDNGNFWSGGGTDYEDLGHVYATHGIDIVKIDDANGIFLVLHETVSGTQTLTKLVVGADASITASTIATIDSSYSGLNSNMDRRQVSMVGHGTGSKNLFFFDHYDSYKLEVQPCTYNSSTDALTWGTYAELDTPTVGGVQTQWSGTYRKNDKQRWSYSIANKKVYFTNMVANKGNGLVLDTQNSTLKVANLGQELSEITSTTTCLTASKDGTELILLGENPRYWLSVVLPWGIDTGELITNNAAAIALEAGVLGETIDISLINGITSDSTDLPATYYLKKNDLFFPYTVYIDGAATAAAGATSVIKSVQRGSTYLGTANNAVTVNIEEVDLDKTLFVIAGGTNYSNYGNSCYITVESSTSFIVKSPGQYQGTGYGSWEVIEYV